MHGAQRRPVQGDPQGQGVDRDASFGQNVDLGLQKTFDAGATTRFQGRIEAFNVFNWVNLGLPDSTIFSSPNVRNPTAGRITTTSTAARQIQLGFKFLF